MSLEKIMSKDVTVLPATATVLDAAKFMKDMNVGSVIVTVEDVPRGLLTDRDIVVNVLAMGKDPGTVKIGKIMVSPIITISEDKDILDVTKLMSSHGIRRLPVINSDGKLVGIISLDDILILLGKEMLHIATTLKTEFKLSEPTSEPIAS